MSGIPARSRVIDADAGSRHAVAITEKGVYTWGSGDQGALGHGDTEQLSVLRSSKGRGASQRSESSPVGRTPSCSGRNGMSLWTTTTKMRTKTPK